MYIVPKRRSRIRPNCQPVSGPSGSIDYTDKQLFNTAETLYTAMLTFAQESASKNASSTTQMRPSCYGLDRTINLFQQGRVGLVTPKILSFKHPANDLAVRVTCHYDSTAIRRAATVRQNIGEHPYVYKILLKFKCIHGGWLKQLVSPSWNTTSLVHVRSFIYILSRVLAK